MPIETVTFDGWEGGEFGELGSREAAKKAIGQERRVRLSPGFWLPTQFNGKNVMRYRDGLLGPRGGVRNFGLTGLGNGLIKAMGNGNNGAWVVIGNTVYSFSTSAAFYGGAAVAYTMTDLISDAFTRPGEAADAEDALTSYLVVAGLNSYKINHATSTVTKMAGATKIPNGYTICYYQSRLLVGGTPTNPMRLFYSDPSSFETFQATSFYDLDGGLRITGLYPFRSGLLVSTLDGHWHYITGTLNSSAVIRVLSRTGAPADPPKGIQLGNDKILYLAGYRPWPAAYNGAVQETFPHLRWQGDSFGFDTDSMPQARALKLLGEEDYMLLSGRTGADAANRSLWFYQGVFSYHTWEQDIRGWARADVAGRVLYAKDGTAGTPPVFYFGNTELHRPGFTTDTDARPGDDSNTPLDAYAHLNQFFDPQGKELHVTGVIVDFKKWNTGAAATNHFDITVRALSRYSNVPLASQTLAWDEAGASSSTTGDDYRAQFGFGDQGHGSAFEIWLDNIRGVAIRSITAIFDRGEQYTY